MCMDMLLYKQCSTLCIEMTQGKGKNKKNKNIPTKFRHKYAIFIYIKNGILSYTFLFEMANF